MALVERRFSDPLNIPSDEVIPSGQVFYIHWNLSATGAATAANYGVIFIANRRCQIVGVRESHTGAGTDAGAVTLDIEKLTGTQALDAGVSMLASTIDLKGAINTVVNRGPTTTAANAILAIGNRIALRDTGVLTAVAGVTVTLEMKWLDQ